MACYFLRGKLNPLTYDRLNEAQHPYGTGQDRHAMTSPGKGWSTLPRSALTESTE